MLEMSKIKEMVAGYSKDNGEFYNEDRLVHFLESFCGTDAEYDLSFDTDALIADIQKDDDLVYNIMNGEGRDLSSITKKYPDYYDVEDVIIFSMGLLFASIGSPIIDKAIQYFCKSGPVPSEVLKGYIDGKVEDLAENDWKYYEEEIQLLFQIADAWYDKMNTNPFKII